MQIHQLPASGTIADADMIPFDTGTVNKYITAGNLLSQQKLMVLANTQDITTSVDALAADRGYIFAINAYGHQSETGMPLNNHYRGIITKSSANNVQILCWTADTTNPTVWLKSKNSTWGGWKMVSGTLTGTVTRGAMMNASDTIDLTACGSTGILRMGCRIDTAGTYGRNDYLMTTSIKASKTGTGVLMLGSTPKIINIDSSGHVFFNNDTAVTAGQYLIGSIVFPVGTWGV